MIFTIIFYVLGFLIGEISAILPVWSIWPEDFTDGIEYFCSHFAELNIIIPIESFFNAAIFLIEFLALYLTIKIFMKILNYIRGTGSGLDI